MTRFPPERQVRLPDRREQRGISLAVHERGDGTAVVLCHGFPELAFSWRYQLDALAGAGFRAIAPDQRGYGGSSRPERIDAYGLTELCGDMVGLLDALGIERAVFAGHDWGGFVAWGMPVLHPERTAGVIGVCTPYIAFPGTAMLRALVDGEDERHYILWFQKAGIAESVMDGRVRLLFERLLRAGVPLEEFAKRVRREGKLDMNPFRRLDEFEPTSELIVTPEELEVYVRAFEKTGFGPGIHWYRNIDRNAAEHPEVGKRKLELPCLMLTAAWDGALRPEMAAGMPALCSDLEMHQIERAGHWVQQERPDELNAHMVDWLQRRFR